MNMLRKAAFALFAAGLVCAGSAFAGDMRGHHRFEHRNHGGWSVRVTGGSDGFVHIPGLGTYVGGVSGAYVRGTGLFLAFDPGVLPAGRPANVPAPKAKIIHVSEQTGKDACSMENGVCVIRAER